MLTPDKLGRIFPKSPLEHRETDTASLMEAAAKAELNTPQRLAMFLGQIGHESYELRYVREVWGPTPQQLRYERDMTQPWAKKGPNSLAFRLNNNQPGDGYLFRGWGFLQVTGRHNTMDASLRLFGDGRLVTQPALLDDRRIGALAAADYWVRHDINALVDSGDDRGVTVMINGAATDEAPSHHKRRIVLRDRALAVLQEAM